MLVNSLLQLIGSLLKTHESLPNMNILIKTITDRLSRFGSGYHTNKLNLRFNAYSEQDGKLSSGLNTLTPEDKRTLADLGDSVVSASSPSIRLRTRRLRSKYCHVQVDRHIGISGCSGKKCEP